MIHDIPTASDFYTTGKELLDFAWDTTAHLLTDIEEAEWFGIDPEEVSDDYWKAAKRHLTTSLSTTQQGIEFILKGKIADISPYLLITDSPQKWPSPYNSEKPHFSDFRTLDAQDLIRVYDTFSPTPFSSDFRTYFENLRDKRNAIMHSIDNRLATRAREVIESILYAHNALFPTESWSRVRQSFLEKAPIAELGAEVFTSNRICWEIQTVINLISPSDVKKYFKIDRKKHAYFCPNCLDDCDGNIDFEYKLARLTPPTPNSTTLYCPVCDQSFKITRKDCDDGLGCEANVLDEEGRCLSCGSY